MGKMGMQDKFLSECYTIFHETSSISLMSEPRPSFAFGGFFL